MMRPTRFQNVYTAVIDNVKKNYKLQLSEAPKYFANVVKPEHKDVVYKKLMNLNDWYTRLIGLDEVKLFQDRVIKLQDDLIKTQEKRREIGRQLAEVRKKSNELQDEIHKVKRQEDLQRFLTLMKEEAEVLKLENDIQRSFQEYDQAERETFTAFANAIRDSHEKQRAQLEYTKYFGLILSILGSFLAFCYTTLKKKDLKYYLETSLASTQGNFNELKKYLESNDEKLNSLTMYINKETLDTLGYIHENGQKLKALLNNKNEMDNSNDNGSFRIISDGNSISLAEPYIYEENKIIKYALYAGLAFLLLKVLTN